MGKKVPLYRASAGLNVKVDPVRVQYDPDKGIVDLQACSNVELDRTGRIKRRKGYTSILSGSMHSIFSCGTYALAMWNYLSQHYLIWIDKVGNNGLIVEIQNYNAPLCYARVGNRIYYSNGFEKGFVENKTSYSWTAGTYVGKDSTKTVSDPPAGHLMEVAFGRMWIAVDSLLYCSEPFAYNQFDLARCIIQNQGRLSLVKAVQDGLYVSDTTGVYYWHGKNPKELEVLKVSSDPAIQGAVVQELVSGVSLGLQDPYLYCLFLTTGGICCGGPQGRFINLTEEKLAYPRALSGSAVLKGNDNILFLLNS